MLMTGDNRSAVMASDRAVARPAMSLVSRCNAADIYRFLTDQHPNDAGIDTDAAFDRHVLAAILSVAVAEADDGNCAERVGLNAFDLVALLTKWFPHARALASIADQFRRDNDECEMVRRLLEDNRARPGADGRWLAAMVARRAMEPNHLWEDLGLRDRDELTRLLQRHFTRLAERNVNNMRWKRFFYRTLCEAEGAVLCRTPSCAACCDFDNCFGEETGESRLARARLNLGDAR